MSIMRLWHGEVPKDKGDEYEQFLLDRAVPDYSSIPGLKKLYFQRRNEDLVTHFLLVTIWDCLDSIKKFAGESPDISKYYPEDDDFLINKEKHVKMYNIFFEQ